MYNVQSTFKCIVIQSSKRFYGNWLSKSLNDFLTKSRNQKNGVITRPEVISLWLLVHSTLPSCCKLKEEYCNYSGNLQVWEQYHRKKWYDMLQIWLLIARGLLQSSPKYNNKMMRLTEHLQRDFFKEISDQTLRPQLLAMGGRVGRCPLPYLTLSEGPSQNLAPGQAWESSSLCSVEHPGYTASPTGQRTGCLNMDQLWPHGESNRPRDILVLFRRNTWEGKDSNRECLGGPDGQKNKQLLSPKGTMMGVLKE